MAQRLLQIIAIVGLGLYLVACSTTPECPEFCPTVCTIAPKNACSRPYTIKGIRYHPQPHFEYEECGIASFYGGGDVFHGRKTATGEVFDKNEVSAAHKTLPLPCIVLITNLENGRQIQAKVNDRGPFVEGRIIDVSRRTAQLLGFEGKGLAKVKVVSLVPESLALRGIDPTKVLVQKSSKTETPKNTKVVLAERLPEDLFDQSIEEEENIDLIANQIRDIQHVSAQSSRDLARGVYVLVKACETQHEAHRVLRSLVGQLHESVTVVEKSGSKPFQIQAGPFLNMADANQALDRLTNAGHVMSRIIIQR